MFIVSSIIENSLLPLKAENWSTHLQEEGGQKDRALIKHLCVDRKPKGRCNIFCFHYPEVLQTNSVVVDKTVLDSCSLFPGHSHVENNQISLCPTLQKSLHLTMISRWVFCKWVPLSSKTYFCTLTSLWLNLHPKESALLWMDGWFIGQSETFILL